MPTTTQALPHYLKRLSGSKEAGLVVAKDAAELARLKQQLDKEKFREVLTVPHLLERIQDGRKNYLVVDAKNAKDIYDTAVQYPTGQIEWFDRDHMSSKVATPAYGTARVLFLATQRTLMAAEHTGLPLRTVCGLTYRT